MRRTVHVHAYASVKGGVGKSTMAVLSAHILDRRGYEVVLMDLDCLGTSLADVPALGLEPPKLQPREDDPETLDLQLKPVGYMTWREAMDARRVRGLRVEHDTGGAQVLPYLNDALFLAEEFWPPRVDALLWRWPGHPNVGVAVSSSVFLDIDNMAKWLATAQARAWARRVWRLTMELIARRPNLTHVILDLPPGLHTYALEAFMSVGLMGMGKALDYGEGELTAYEQLLSGVDFVVRRNVIVSPDPQDLAMGVDALRILRPTGSDIELLLNRMKDALDDAWERIEPAVGPFVHGLGIKQAIRSVSNDQSLGRIFQNLELDTLDAALVDSAARALRLDPSNSGVGGS